MRRGVRVWPLKALEKLFGTQLGVASHHAHELVGAQCAKLNAEVNMLGEALAKGAQALLPVVKAARLRFGGAEVGRANVLVRACSSVNGSGSQ